MASSARSWQVVAQIAPCCGGQDDDLAEWWGVKERVGRQTLGRGRGPPLGGRLPQDFKSCRVIEVQTSADVAATTKR